MKETIKHTKKAYRTRQRVIDVLLIVLQAIAGFVFLVSTIALGVFLGHAMT